MVRYGDGTSRHISFRVFREARDIACYSQGGYEAVQALFKLFGFTVMSVLAR